MALITISLFNLLTNTASTKDQPSQSLKQQQEECLEAILQKVGLDLTIIGPSLKMKRLGSLLLMVRENLRLSQNIKNMLSIAINRSCADLGLKI